MGVWDVLFNAAGGGILGSALHVFTDWMDTKNKVTLLNAQMNAAEKTEAWKAFTSSQQDTGIKTLPDRAPVWVLSVYLLVQALKEAIRPMLALLGIAIIAYIYISGTEAARKDIAQEILFGSFTVIFWYVGARYSRTR